MSRLRVLAAMVLLVVVIAIPIGARAGAGWPLALGGVESTRIEWYLALGDSVSAGYGTAQPSEQGYASDVGRLLSAGGAPTDFTNLAIPGETTGSMLSGGQLDRAVRFLEQRRGSRGLVTISIGGNDVARLYGVCPFASTDVCRRSAVDTIAGAGRGLDSVLGALRTAAGLRTRIVVLSYYNPLLNPGCRLHPLEPLARAVIEGGAPLDLSPSLNQLIKARASAIDARSVDLGGVITAERLTADCLHPNRDGHAVIAEEVMRAVR